jgi:hypothetical protein
MNARDTSPQRKIEAYRAQRPIDSNKVLAIRESERGGRKEGERDGQVQPARGSRRQQRESEREARERKASTARREEGSGVQETIGTSLVLYDKKKKSSRGERRGDGGDARRGGSGEERTDLSIKELKEELRKRGFGDEQIRACPERRDLERLLQGRHANDFGPTAWSRAAVEEARRKITIDTSQRLNHETGALVIYDDNVRKKMRDFKLDRAEYAVSPPKAKHRHQKADELAQSKVFAKKFEVELAMRLTHSIRYLSYILRPPPSFSQKHTHRNTERR